ncbi:MAG: methionine synthase [Deltaproteobacteria bacterium]|nr:methionine synthase [Deltaproteobacteria bacterium]
MEIYVVNPSLRKTFLPRCMAIAIGSLPQSEVTPTLDLIAECLPEAPFWPQLPNRSFLEGMYVQYGEGLPGAVLDVIGERFYIDPEQADFAGQLTSFYEAVLAADLEYFAISPERAAGLWQGLPALAQRYQGTAPMLVKGHVTGPISFGLGVTDVQKKAIIYDPTMADVVVKHLNMKARWQEKFLERCFPGLPTLTFFDEPYMVSFGTAFCALSRERVRELLNEVSEGLTGLTGVHCCGNTDWSLLLDTRVDLLNFDAYEYGENLLLYRSELEKFLSHGGYLAWGVVPTSAAVDSEDVDSLFALLTAQMECLSGATMPLRRILERSFISPSCGAGSLTPARAIRVFALTVKLTERLREHYGL